MQGRRFAIFGDARGVLLFLIDAGRRFVICYQHKMGVLLFSNNAGDRRFAIYYWHKDQNISQEKKFGDMSSK